MKLKFLNNFDIININEIKNLFRSLITFNKNNNIYFYYEYLYLFENNEFKKIINENEILQEETEFKKSNIRKRTKVIKKNNETKNQKTKVEKKMIYLQKSLKI